MESEQVMHTLFAIRAYVRTSYHRTWTPVDIIFEWCPKTTGAHHSYFYRVQRYIKSGIYGLLTMLFTMFYSHLLIYIILNINILGFLNVCFTMVSGFISCQAFYIINLFFYIIRFERIAKDSFIIRFSMSGFLSIFAMT